MDYEAIVIGGGHAGLEACLALARIGHKTLLITQNLDAIARMSCNPAIGGLAKGNIVREVDALGGEMGLLIDEAMIQFRILNRRRGAAVQAPRAQADKYLYSRLAGETVKSQKNLDSLQDTVTDFLVNRDGSIGGVKTEGGLSFTAKTVVLTTGTFMDGRLFIGDWDAPGGRMGEPAAIGLGDSLRRMGFETGRMKTGTPARILRTSIDYDAMELQPGDESIVPFSFMNESLCVEQEPCHITWTNERTHEIIRANINRSPLYGGKIVGKGPRYCPSIEDKVVRFPDRERHQVFVEPEGRGSDEMYLNGLSSSLPKDTQEAFIHSIRGLENAVIVRYAYAVEYDYMNPLQLKPSLESKRMPGLFVAGQTNGTSGYEEAAGQGIVAGINASQYLNKGPALILQRDEAYTGVLIDDLVTMGTKEPYRMFTSRAEYRLNLRSDTADRRLTEKAGAVGLAGPERLEALRTKYANVEAVKDLLRKNSYEHKKAIEALKSPLVELSDMKDAIPALGSFPASVLYTAELDVKYEGYLKRQESEVRHFRRMENIRIPEKFDYSKVVGLSAEAREKFEAVRPLSIGQASRISGVRMSDVAILSISVEDPKGGGDEE